MSLFILLQGRGSLLFVVTGSIQNKQSWKEMSLSAYPCYCFSSVPACAFEMNLPLVTMSCALVLSTEQFLSEAQTGFLLVKCEVEGVL